MSTEELGTALNEPKLAEAAPNTAWGTLNFLLGLTAKYGFATLACCYLFWVIKCKDDQIYALAMKSTEALIESNHVLRELSDTIKNMK